MGLFIGVCAVAATASFLAGAASRLLVKPAWSHEYEVELAPDVGTKHADIPYGDGIANAFDLYLPANDEKGAYGLVVYLHAGGFTAGDKADDVTMLSWLCSKGYVAAGINYTLFSEENPQANVLTQSQEIKAAMPHIVEEAARLGYPIDAMAIGGGSAGHALAMIYAYRDASTSPVPVRLLFGAVGPSSFYTEDWDVYGLDRQTKESRTAAAALFGTMSGSPITPEMIKDGSYLERVKPISSVMWIDENSVPSVVAYGTHDKAQPYRGAERLRDAYARAGIDYRFFACPHSGHGLQNDSAIYRAYMQAVKDYLGRYLPV